MYLHQYSPYIPDEQNASEVSPRHWLLVNLREPSLCIKIINSPDWYIYEEFPDGTVQVNCT